MRIKLAVASLRRVFVPGLDDFSSSFVNFKYSSLEYALFVNGAPYAILEKSHHFVKFPSFFEKIYISYFSLGHLDAEAKQQPFIDTLMQ